MNKWKIIIDGNASITITAHSCNITECGVLVFREKNPNLVCRGRILASYEKSGWKSCTLIHKEPEIQYSN